jgi:cyclase
LNVLIVFVSIFFVVNANAQYLDDPWQIEFRQISPDIHFGFRPEPLRYIVEGNVTIVINDNDVVVIDGSGSPTSGRRVIAYIKKQTDNPVSTVIVTHGHGDHSLGLEEYVKAFPGVEIIAHPKTYEYMTGSGIGYVADMARSVEQRKKDGFAEIERVKKEAAEGYEEVVVNLTRYYGHVIDVRREEYRKITITPPTLTVSDRLILHRGRRTFDINFFGPGDTNGDLVVFLPQDRLVITGDMTVGPIPYGYSGYPIEWVNTLNSVLKLDFDTLIPGHGQVKTGKSYLTQIRNLLLDMRRQVEACKLSGLTVEETLTCVDVEEHLDAFGGDDPVLRYYFVEYFSTPHIQRVYGALGEN